MVSADRLYRIYAEAVRLNPKFDIGLANLANALKDAVRTQTSLSVGDLTRII